MLSGDDARFRPSSQKVIPTAGRPKAIESFMDLFRVAEFCGQHLGKWAWYRGQPNAAWNLVPQLFRDPFDKLPATTENNLLYQFRRQATARRTACPNDEDYPGWLFLAQHYGLPTRLLDWTDSILAALFFATVSAGQSASATIWALNPYALNAIEANRDEVFTQSRPDVRHLAEYAFDPNRFAAIREQPRCCAVAANHTDPRMHAQSAVFTFHRTAVPLQEHRHASRFLIGFEIPSRFIATLLAQLDLLAVNESTIFPDLQNLARFLVRRQIACSITSAQARGNTPAATGEHHRRKSRGKRSAA